MSGTLLSLPAFKVFMGITSSTDDDKMQAIVDGVSRSCLNFMDRPEVWSEDDVRYPQPDRVGNGRIIVPWPLVALTSIHEDPDGFFGQAADSFQAADELELGVDFAYDPTENFRGIIQRIDGASFCSIPGSIKVVMTWGWQTIPRDLDLAVKRLASAIWNNRGRVGPISSERFGDYSYDVLTDMSGPLAADFMVNASRGTYSFGRGRVVPDHQAAQGRAG